MVEENHVNGGEKLCLSWKETMPMVVKNYVDILVMWKVL